MTIDKLKHAWHNNQSRWKLVEKLTEINFRTLVPRVFLFPNMAGEDLGTWLPFSNGTFSNDVTSAILVLQNKLWSHYRLLPG